MHANNQGSANSQALQKIAVATLVALTVLGIWFNGTRRAGATAVKLSPAIGAWQPTEVTAAALLGCESHPKGSASGYSLVEFGDSQSQPCRVENKVVQEILASEKGRLGFDFVDFPMAGHPNNYVAALYATAAGRQKAYWPLHDWLMTCSSADPSSIDKRAKQLKLDVTRLDVDRQAPSVNEEVQKNIAAASRLGVNTLPSYFLACPNGMVVRFWYARDVKTYLLNHVR